MLDQGVPKTLGLKDILSKYIDYQKEIIIRRTRYDIRKAEERAHILEGLKIALDNIDAVVQLIRASKSDQEAKDGLMAKFGLDDIQATAILDMRLRRLTGLERDKIEAELQELLEKIQEYRAILASEEKVLAIIKEELLDIKNRYADERRTKIDMTAIDYIEDESLIPNEDVIITLTNKGYIKRVTSDTFKAQNRGGVGIKGMATNEEDFVENIVSMTTHDDILFFTNKGRVYRMRGYEVPLYSRQSKGLPIINLLPLASDELVRVMLKITPSEADSNNNLVFCTQSGLVKKTSLKEFENIRTNGKIAITLKEDDELIAVKKTTGNDEVLVAADNGRMVRFVESEIRNMGRTAAGVKGIDVGDGKVIGCEVCNGDKKVLVVTENGYGKKTVISEYRMTHRGSKGVKALNMTEKTGNIVSIKIIEDNQDLMIVTDSGIIIRLPLDQVSNTGRVTQGVKLINLKDGQKVSTVAVMEHSEEEINSVENLGNNENTNEIIEENN